MSLTENTKELTLEEIIEEFNFLQTKEDIENKIYELGLELEDEKKEFFIRYIQEANSSGGIVKSTKLEGILKADGIDEVNYIFEELFENYKNRIENNLDENKNKEPIHENIFKLQEIIKSINEQDSLIKYNSELLFNLSKGLLVGFSELSEIYGKEKITEDLRKYLNTKSKKDLFNNEKLHNLFDFIKFIEPDKNKRKKLYEKINGLNLGDTVGKDGIGEENYKNKLSFLNIANESDKSGLFDFYFKNKDFLSLGFLEKFKNSDGDIITLLNNMKTEFVDKENEKLTGMINSLKKQGDIILNEDRLSISEKEIIENLIKKFNNN